MYQHKLRLVQKFVAAFPVVKEELNQWAILATSMPEPLRTQALLSIEGKSFHCLGGSIYAHYPGADQKLLVRLIVALQTISDYLDNLCDRLKVKDATAFRVLHQSFTAALTPGESIGNYYEAYPYYETTYLPALVGTCQTLVAQLPFYPDYQNQALDLASFYCELQVLKHVAQGERHLKDWVVKTFDERLYWNEWAAATGSTLGIFFLFALSSIQPGGEIESGYFPWIQALHILLDYLIDLEEDQIHGDLNFINYYQTSDQCTHRLDYIAKKAKDCVQKLPEPIFHETVVQGLIALYGSDPKVKKQKLQPIIKALASDKTTWQMLKVCRLLRYLNYLT